MYPSRNNPGGPTRNPASSGGLAGPPHTTKQPLLPFVLFEFLLDFPLYRIEVKARGCLHRGELDGRLCKLSHRLLHANEAPELARIEIVHVAAAYIVHALAANRHRPLERVLTDIH